MKYSLACRAEANWTIGIHQALEERDLKLEYASNGQMRAFELRAQMAGEIDTWPTVESSSFLFLYPLSGEIVFTMSDGEFVTLGKRDAVLLPFLRGTRSARYSADFSAVEIAAPGRSRPSKIEPLLQIDSSALQGAWESAVARSVPDAYKRGEGPRNFFTYRDLGATKLTGGRIKIHDGEETGPVQVVEGGTGWHNHTMSQIFIVLNGEVVLQVEGHGEHRMVKGDAMTLGAGMRHNVSSYSANYSVVEMCLPAIYETAAQATP
jgi:uncharacterized protein YjlB